ncbi:MAG: hypothetical protein IVW55_00475 [Chloroflexi bacterium]|nr:hypothetical protein [Chloroflexota bacterium]
MNNTAPSELQHDSISDGPLNSFRAIEIEATIHALEQRATQLEEARYEALREVRGATRRVTELSLQAMEARMRLCALIECEPLQKDARIGKRDRPAILQLAHMYFDEPGKYRLVMCARYDGACTTSEQVGEPEWCSKVVYDTMRPEGKGSLALADAVRAAYRAAETRGYRLVWTTAEIPGDHKPGSITSPGQYSCATEVLCHEQEV